MIEDWIPQYSKLEERQQRKVANQFAALDIDEVRRTYEEGFVNPRKVDIDSIDEVPFVRAAEMTKDCEERLAGIAQDAVNNGAVAALLMAGGQGTRLGHKGPKGKFSFEDVSLFELQARKIKNFDNGGTSLVHWYIMTSDVNHEETMEFFRQKTFFGMPPGNVHFFKQEHFPPMSKDGELLLTEDADIMETPNGNGGIFSSLQKSGMLDDMASRGILHIFMNNVDNVVVKVLDPLLLGLHIDDGNEVTSKSITPEPGESVGRLSLIDGDKGVVEYTELPVGKDHQFTNGNMGVHVFSIDWLKGIGETAMPYHTAHKKLEFLDDGLGLVKEKVLKFEKFYFDAFKHASQHNTLQVDRKGEFSPLKNKEGKDSISTAYNDLKDEGLI